MDRSQLAFAGAARQAELIRAGEVSSRELVELYLERIERIDPQLNAYRVVLAERALAEADQADARRGANEDRPLLGVPIALKDNMDIAGEVTTQGTAAHGGPAGEDAELVRRLRGAGAVILGKTNLPELAIMGATESANYGITRNPWNLDRTPAGSSGGSGAAVAAGLAAAATASDGMGSIRNPAACCNLVGLKPQRDRIPLAPLPEHWHGLSVLGFNTRTVADTALLVDLTADGLERALTEAAAAAPGRLRVALSAKPPLPVRSARKQVRRALEDMGSTMRALGHEVFERDPDYGQAGNPTLVRYLRGMCDEGRGMAHPERLQRRTRGFVRLGGLIPQAVLRRAIDSEAGYHERMNRIFSDADVVVTPVMTTLPPRAEEWEGMGALRTLIGMAEVFPYAGVWNMTGQPACAVPAGLSQDGLPIGMQLVGRPGDEATLISLAAQLEAELGWPQQRPPL